MIDLAVIGGGLAGSYVAFRMSGIRPDWSIALLESCDRIGGRLLSVRMPGTDTPVELGGMRYRASQRYMHQLVEELGLQTSPFPVAHEDNRFFLRNVELRSPEMTEEARVPYQLDVPWDKKTPAEAIIAAFELVVPRATLLGAEDWQRIRELHRFGGRLLRDWSLRELLMSVMGREGYNYLVDGLGYSSIIGDWNAADAIPWFLIETRPDTENLTVADGMERVPRELGARFEKVGGTITTGFHLQMIGIDQQSEGRSYRLTSADGSEVLARRVVLALPRRSLERVVERSSALSRTEIRHALESVAPHEMTKLFLWYANAWWRGMGLQGRRTISDLPLRKTYFLDASPAGPALLLASYCDGPAVEYWRRFARSVEAPSDPKPYDAADRWEAYASPRNLTDEAQRLVQALHPHPAEEPVGGAFLDWGMFPFEGAWHSWNTSVKSWELVARLVQPNDEEDIYICGEAYSNYQGWMEGALETAEMVVERLSSQPT